MSNLTEPRMLRRQREHLEEGRGAGSGPDYLPFIQIGRAGFQSRGRSHLLFNDRLDRHHHLLSDLELLIFLWAWSLNPTDCREQFPLQLYEFDPLFSFRTARARGSLEIAAARGVKHPQITRNGPRVMTTDLLVSFADGTHLAIHAKYLKELLNSSERASELRGIEKHYWMDRGVRFMVVDETPFTKNVADLMMWAIDGMKWDGDSEAANAVLMLLGKTPTREPLGCRLDDCSSALGLSSEQGVRAFKYAVLTQRWKPRQLNQELDLTCAWPGKRARTQSPLTARRIGRPAW